jgi:hypothetical protein
MTLFSDIASAGQTFSHGFEQSGGHSSGSNSERQRAVHVFRGEMLSALNKS